MKKILLLLIVFGAFFASCETSEDLEEINVEQPMTEEDDPVNDPDDPNADTPPEESTSN
ncbi:MAG: hypothetical protein NXI20_08280 [bacterium]|nr:hypothetical protein [bacterium]